MSIFQSRHGDTGLGEATDGKVASHRQYGGMPQIYARVAFPDSVIRPMLDPDRAIAEYRGEIDLAAACCHNNRYWGTFEVRDDRIVRVSEYLELIDLSRAAGEDALARTFRIDDARVAAGAGRLQAEEPARPPAPTAGARATPPG